MSSRRHSFEGGLLAVDAQHFRGHFGAAGGIDREDGCRIGPKHPQPPAFPSLPGYRRTPASRSRRHGRSLKRPCAPRPPPPRGPAAGRPLQSADQAALGHVQALPASAPIPGQRPPQHYLSYASRARNIAANRPLGTTFGGRGAHTATRRASLAGHWQRRRQPPRRHRIRRSLTSQSGCSEPRYPGTRIRAREQTAAAPAPRRRCAPRFPGAHARGRDRASPSAAPARQAGPPVPFVAVLAAAALAARGSLFAWNRRTAGRSASQPSGSDAPPAQPAPHPHVQRGLTAASCQPAPRPASHGHDIDSQHPHRPSR